MSASLAIVPDRDRNIASDVGVITKDTPLRLEMAAKLAFPDGSMKLAGLRREASRGRLTTEMIAGKMYTTLAHIDEMRKICRRSAKAHDSGKGHQSGKTAKSFEAPSGSSETETKLSPRDALLAKLAQSRQQKQNKR